MNEIGIDWTDLLPAYLLYRVLVGGLGLCLLYDYACLVGKIDGPNVSHWFRLMAIWMVMVSAGMVAFSVAGYVEWMAFSTIAALFGKAALRLWTWRHHVYLSDIAEMHK